MPSPLLDTFPDKGGFVFLSWFSQTCFLGHQKLFNRTEADIGIAFPRPQI